MANVPANGKKDHSRLRLTLRATKNVAISPRNF